MSKIIDKALEITSGDRAEAYGPAEQNFKDIADLWTVILRKKLLLFPHCITAHDVAVMMTGMKVLREANKHGEDNLVDIVGYVICDEKVLEKLGV